MVMLVMKFSLAQNNHFRKSQKASRHVHIALLQLGFVCAVSPGSSRTSTFGKFISMALKLKLNYTFYIFVFQLEAESSPEREEA